MQITVPSTPMAGKQLYNKYQGPPCPKGHDGMRYASGNCIECSRASSRRRAATPEGREKKRLAYWKEGGSDDRRARNWKRNYGVTPEEYNRMLAAQDYGCAICQLSFWNYTQIFHIDHDHATGKVRALLCHKCNLMLGSSNDEPRRLEQAAAYLRKHGKE